MSSISNVFGSGGGSDPKAAVMQQIQQESNVNNARQLIEKLNEACFERCVPKPGSSLSSSESTCISQCMEKYMAAWNTVSRQYIGRLQREGESPAIGGV
ncbi:MAG: protein translocase subunit [Chaenotheca gracillima]|nr:MAG: protein translocase subunit [Chaenotheca gracillima]